MPPRILQLVFAPSEEIGQGSGYQTVLMNEFGALAGVPGTGCREFYGADYEQMGRKVCLWWFRQFSQPNTEGLCLHDLFEWDRWSILWFTDTPVLNPEFGTFPRLMTAIRTLALFKSGEIQSVRIIGNELALAAVFHTNGIPYELIPTPVPKTASSGLAGKLKRGLVQFYRWYLEGKILRLLHHRQHRAGQTDTLFYSVNLNEWRIPGDGKHRYHADLLEELLDTGMDQEVRPFVSITPPSRIDSMTWKSFIGHSLNAMKGFYAPGFTSLQVMMKAREWNQSLCERIVRWRKHPPVDFGRWEYGDFHNLLDEQLSQAIGTALPLVVRYEALKTAFRKAHPKALLLKDEVYSEGRLLVAAARSAGIRTISTQHGSIYPTHWCYVMDPEAKGLSRPPLPDVLGVYGSAIARLLVEKGGMPENILHVMGARRFSHLDRCRASREISQFAEPMGKVVLLAGQMHQDMAVLFDWIFKAARDLPDLRFVVKPHPRDQVHLHMLETRCRELSNTLFFRGPLDEVLPAALVTISSHSTVLLESVWLGIPAVSVQVSGETPAEWQTGAGILRVVRDYDDLLNSLAQAASGTLVDDSSRARAAAYLEEYLGYSLCQDTQVLRRLFSPQE